MGGDKKFDTTSLGGGALAEEEDRKPTGAVHARPGATVKFNSGGEVASAARARNLYAAGAARLAEGDALAAQAEAEGKAAREQAGKLQQWSEGVRQLENEALSASMRNAQNVQKLGQMVGSFRPRPGRLFQDSSAAASWGAAMSLAASTFQSTRSGGANGAMQIIQAAIQQDLAAQELMYDAKKSELQSAQTLYTQMRASYGDAIVARQAQRAALLEAAKQRIAAAGAPHKGEAQRQEKIALGMELAAKGNQTLIDMAQKEYTLTTYARAKELGPALLGLLPRDLQMKLLENSGQADLATLYGLSSAGAEQLVKQAGMSEEKAKALKAAVDADAKSLDAAIKNGAAGAGVPNQGGSNQGTGQGSNARQGTSRGQGNRRRGGAAPVDVVDTTETTDVEVGPDGDVEVETSASEDVLATGQNAQAALPEARQRQQTSQQNLSTAQESLATAQAALEAADAKLAQANAPEETGILTDVSREFESWEDLKIRTDRRQTARKAAEAAQRDAVAAVQAAEEEVAARQSESQAAGEVVETLMGNVDAAQDVAAERGRVAADERRSSVESQAGAKDTARAKKLIGELRASSTGKGSIVSADKKELAELNKKSGVVAYEMNSLLPTKAEDGQQTSLGWWAPVEAGSSDTVRVGDKIGTQMEFIRMLGGATNIDLSTREGARIMGRARRLGDRAFLAFVDKRKPTTSGEELRASRMMQQVNAEEIPVVFLKKYNAKGEVIEDKPKLQAALSAAGVGGVTLESGWITTKVKTQKYRQVDTKHGHYMQPAEGETVEVEVAVPVYYNSKTRDHRSLDNAKYEFGAKEDIADKQSLLGDGPRVFKAGVTDDEKKKYKENMKQGRELQAFSRNLLAYAGVRSVTDTQGVQEGWEKAITVTQQELNDSAPVIIEFLKGHRLTGITPAKQRKLIEDIRQGRPQDNEFLSSTMAPDPKNPGEFLLTNGALAGAKGTISHFYGFMAPQKAELEIVNESLSLNNPDWYNPADWSRLGVAKRGIQANGFVQDLENRLQAYYDTYTTDGVGAEEAYNATLNVINGTNAPAALRDIYAGRGGQ